MTPWPRPTSPEYCGAVKKYITLSGLAIGLCALPLLLNVTGCATSGYEQNTGESVAERGISSRVRELFEKDTQYKYGSVHVETHNATVQLSGTVNSIDQRNRAGELAGRLEGVREVVNNITVTQPAS